MKLPDRKEMMRAYDEAELSQEQAIYILAQTAALSRHDLEQRCRCTLCDWRRELVMRVIWRAEHGDSDVG